MKRQDHIYDFFLAYAGADKQAAETLYQLLTPYCKVFLDVRSIKLGDDWDQSLVFAQTHSLITVVLVSARTEKAYYQREEIAAAIEMARKDKEGHRLVPVFLDGRPNGESNIPYGLRLKHGLFITETGGPTEVAQKLLDLLDHVKQNSSIGNPHEPREQCIDEQSRGTDEDLTLGGISKQYFCYISHEKIDQLCNDYRRAAQTVGRANDEDLTAHKLPYNSLMIKSILNADLSYGRPDLFHMQRALKQAYLEKLKSVLPYLVKDVEEFKWVLADDSTDNIFFWYRGVFRALNVDEDQLMASLITKHENRSLILYSSLRYFSHLTVKADKIAFQSTNYPFFKNGLPVVFETIFLLISMEDNTFYGSPIYLKLGSTKGLSL